MADRPDFEHQPLGDREFRLLRLRRSSEDVYPPREGPAEFDIANFSIDSCPPYTALSYTWGAEDAAHPILLNGRAFRVRSNLASFLEHVQHIATPGPTPTPAEGQAPPSRLQKFIDRVRNQVTVAAAVPSSSCDPPDSGVRDDASEGSVQSAMGYLWIDALCINQADEEEKFSQIEQMKDIFAKSSRVVIWLGPAADNSDLAMDSVAELCREYRGQVPADGIELAEESASALEALGKRPWWRRVWVWQEATTPDVAREFWCGPRRCSFEDMSRLNAMLLASHSNPSPEVVNAYNPGLSRMNRLAEARSQRAEVDIGAVLEISENLDATDDRDKIFAFLPVYQDLCQGELPTLDRRATLPQLLQATTRFAIETSGSTEILKYCSYEPGVWPTWVPKFKTRLLLRGVNLFACSGDKSDVAKRFIKFSDSAAAYITFRGIGIDEITSTLAIFEDKIYELEQRECWQVWMQALASETHATTPNQAYPRGVQDVVKALNAALAADLSVDYSSLAMARGTPFSYPFDDPDGLVEAMDVSSQNDIFTIYSFEDFFKTSKGYFGRCQGPRKGDAVVCFPGLPIPMVLRPWADGWMMVGPCFVAGMMDGEALQLDVKPSEYKIY